MLQINLHIKYREKINTLLKNQYKSEEEYDLVDPSCRKKNYRMMLKNEVLIINVEQS